MNDVAPCRSTAQSAASKRRTRLDELVCALAMLLAGCPAHADLDELAEKLTWSNADGSVVANAATIVDATLYAQDAPAQALLFSDNDAYFAPRISTFLDVGFGERVVLHAQLTADRGFDPGEHGDGDVRFDEYFVETRVTDAARLTLRIGKFATAFGAWNARHLAWDDPLIVAPLVYSDVLPVTDHAAPPTRAAFANRRNLVDNQPDWVPIVWGPSYATGASLSASSETLDFIVEVKNAALSSRPDVWDVIGRGFDTAPTVTGHVRWHPGAEWWFGASASDGPYLQKQADATLPVGQHVDDYQQTTFGIDAAYEHRRLQVWSEVVRVRFDVPNVGDVSGVSGFVETKLKLTSRTWLAARANASWFDDVPGLTTAWNRDMRRLDLGVGFRATPHVEGKLSYSWSDQAGREVDGDRLFAVQFVVTL